MSFSDETLMAYADGELDTAQRGEVEAAMAADPEVARRVEQHRSLRKQFRTTYDRVLMETVPDRLIAAARRVPSEGTAQAPTQTPAETVSEMRKRGATVTDLRRVRAARRAEAAEAAAAVKRSQPPRPPWGWFEWGAMAASLVVGAVGAYLVIQSPESDRFSTVRGQLVASADLDLALSHQLASDPIPGSAVRIGVSFKSKDGTRCRTFIVKEAQPIGGLACREDSEWRIHVLANAERTASSDEAYQQAGAQLPAAVLAAAQNTIDGEPFDAEGEVAARDRGWEK